MVPIAWPPEVLTFAEAIAFAEGSPPAWNNPLDMTISLGFPTLGIGNPDGVLKFVNLDDGWYVGRHQCWLMLSGKSTVYKLTDTLAEVGLKYSNGDPAWAKNVCDYLKFPETITLAQLAETAY